MHKSKCFQPSSFYGHDDQDCDSISNDCASSSNKESYHANKVCFHLCSCSQNYSPACYHSCFQSYCSCLDSYHFDDSGYTKAHITTIAPQHDATSPLDSCSNVNEQWVSFSKKPVVVNEADNLARISDYHTIETPLTFVLSDESYTDWTPVKYNLFNLSDTEVVAFSHLGTVKGKQKQMWEHRDNNKNCKHNVWSCHM